MFPSRVPVVSVTPPSDTVLVNTYSLAFDGTNDNGIIPRTTFNVDGANISFSIWAKRGVTNVKHTIFGNVGSDALSFIRFSTDGKLAINSDTSSDVATATLTDDDTNWHHYVLSISSGVVTAYQDAGSALSVSGNVGDDNITLDIIGGQKSVGTTNEFNGNLDEIGIWSTNLSSAEVTALYGGGTPIALDSDSGDYASSSDLIHWWRMGDGDDDSFPIFGDQVTPPTLGSELFDSDGKAFVEGGTYNGTNPSEHAADTYGWIQQGSNGLENESGELKITYSNNADGARLYLRNASDLSAEADANSVYKLTFQARYAGGSSGVKGLIYNAAPSGANYHYSDAFTTSMATYTIYYQTFTAPQSIYVQLDTMASSNVVYLDNFSLKKVPGAFIVRNMTSGDVVEDVPSS